MKNIFLIEDHDQALTIWKKQNVKGLDLVHIDAHIDFGAQQAKPIEKIFNEAKSLKELKKGLEHSLAFLDYENDFDKQINIGNYIYPAIQAGIVNSFYWVVPGGQKEFKKSAKFIKNIIKVFRKQGLIKSGGKGQGARARFREGIFSLELLGRKFVICILEKLPALKEKVLLDIDTDFLVIESLIVANSTQKIGERKPWISPNELANSLENKKIKPKIVTIAYSVNGGYTPMIYKHLGDEIAYNFSPKIFRESFDKSSEASRHFGLFSSTGKSKYYKKAVRINSSYRAGDNNYGLIYLQIHKLNLAEKEFLRILRADSKNPASIAGLGYVALERKNFREAKERFASALRNVGSQKLFIKAKEESLLGLARAEFGLKNFGPAKNLLIRYQSIRPLQSQSYYLLGRIYEKEKKYSQAANSYKNAIRLGFTEMEPLWRLLKIVLYTNNKDDIIKFVYSKYREFKKRFLKGKTSVAGKRKIQSLHHRLENKIKVVERILRGRN